MHEDHKDQPVCCIPDVSIIERDPEKDEFLVGWDAYY